ncbi:MAG: glycerol kinase GlpK [Halofilum sp. (in: g-proteobacteria)]|nr:glycerol kinase GlpK [Halofilum sp. (in: g-proteobacteria)]
MSEPLLLAIDQGTTSSRAILFDRHGHVHRSAQREFRQIYPHDGWVEHDPEEIWSTTLGVCREAVGPDAGRIAALGITNQRETTLVWDRDSGEPVCNAIVWQDRRTADQCSELVRRNREGVVRKRTGLLLDPYFSGTKIAWILDNVPGVRERADRGELAFGTVDTFLIWRLTRGRVHATDATNASRTLLFNIHEQRWDDELLELLDVPRSLLPEVRDSADDFGVADEEWLGRPLPISGVAGDQQAALVGQACLEPGMVKSTYGTGCFVVLNTGTTPVESANKLLTTVGYRLEGRTAYALEGSIFVAGAAIQWLRDRMGLLAEAGESASLADSLPEDHGVQLVPAFTGLGAPHWDPHARGAVFGITPNTGPAHFARAVLESVCYQTHDLLYAMIADGAQAPSTLRVDGGMAANDWLVERLADITAVPVERPDNIETTAIGAARLAGLQAGVYDSLDEISSSWRLDRRAEPKLDEQQRQQHLQSWSAAVEAVRRYAADRQR